MIMIGGITVSNKSGEKTLVETDDISVYFFSQKKWFKIKVS